MKRKFPLIIMSFVIGMSQAVAEEYEYVPMVREGVKWQCHYDNPFTGDYYDDYSEQYKNLEHGRHNFTLEIKGDYEFNGKTYKGWHYYSGDAIDPAHDTIPLYVREEDKVVYGYIPGNERVLYKECPTGIGNYNSAYEPDDDNEIFLYNFKEPEQFYLYEEDEYGYRAANLLDTDTILVGQSQRKCYKFEDTSEFMLVEGVGCVSPFWYTLRYLIPMMTGEGYDVYYIFDRMIEEGKVVYENPYGRHDSVEEAVADSVRENEDATYYNLLGQPVNNPTRGIYIHRGKKLIIQ